MKKYLFAMKNGVGKAVAALNALLLTLFLSARRTVANNSGEGYIDTAIKILLAVVLGALLLAGLYALFGDTVLPTLTRKIQEMFNYNG